MVKPLNFAETKYFSKRELFLAITMLVVAFSFLGNFVLAAEMKITDEQVEKVKTALNIVNTAANFGSVLLSGGNLMTVLKTAIKGGGIAADVTYGLLVLSAINEMEFMDLVLSGAYKNIARDYFNGILDERINLISYWKGVGFDITKVLSGTITGPVGALALNSFAITDKAIQIFSEFNVLEKMKLYDGLWRYFDERGNGESHLGAWELAEPEMGFAAKRFLFRAVRRVTEDDTSELEQQFSALWEKWGPYATSYGMSEEYKKQAKADLTNTLVSAFEEHTENGSLYAEEPSLWDKFLAQLASIKNSLTNIVSQINPFSAGPIILPSDEGDETRSDRVSLAENSSPLAEEHTENGSLQTSEQEDLDDILEGADILNQENTEEAEESADVSPIQTEEPVFEPEIKEIIEATTTEPEIKEAGEVEESETIEVQPPLIDVVNQSLCQKGEAGAVRQFRVLINEVAWMGDKESPNNEWIEIKNIWGIPIDLFGWQIQDKDQQIKWIFKDNEILPVGGLRHIERGKDYTGALSNSNEAIYLFDNQCLLEDQALANPDWPAGENSDKKTMQRFDFLNWYSQEPSLGLENLAPLRPIYISGPAPAPSEATILAYPKILITETQISPIDGRFVELYNPNDSEISLTDWYIQRKTATGDSFNSFISSTQFGGKIIPAHGYFLIARELEEADIILNITLTENNALVLKNPNREITDEVSTNSPAEGQSYGRIWSIDEQGYLNEFEIQTPTPRAQNVGLIDDDDNDDDGGGVVINEIAWAGTEADWHDEWIELYASSDTNLEGWKILGIINGQTELEIVLSGFASSSSYILIERSDDNTVSDTGADFLFSGNLDNDGMTLELRDAEGNLVDSVGGWFAGNNDTKQTMERINPLTGPDPVNWANNNMITRNGLDIDGNRINGTPNAENSVSKTFTEVQTNLLVFDKDFTLTYLGSPYLMDGSMQVLSGAKLTIEPGVIIKFKENYYQHSLLTVEGELYADGITFTSASEQPAAGDWDGIYFSEGSEGYLNNIVIKYAGKVHQSPTYSFPAYSNGSVKIEEADVVIENSTIENSQSHGLWVINSSPLINNTAFLNNNNPLGGAAFYVNDENSTPVISNSVFKGNTFGVWIGSGASPEITGNIFEENETPINVSSSFPHFAGNSAQNNFNGNGVFFAGVIFRNANWQADLPYIIQDSLTVAEEVELNIEPGAMVKFSGGAKMIVDGYLFAQAEDETPIIFTSLTDADFTGGYYIYFSSLGEESVLENVIVRYGGASINYFGGHKAAITVEDTYIAIYNSVIENNIFAGLFMLNSDSEIQSTIFRDNNRKYSDWGTGAYSKGIYLVNSPEAYLSGSYFERNYHGIYIEDINSECPDLSGVSFGTGADANTFDVAPFCG